MNILLIGITRTLIALLVITLGIQNLKAANQSENNRITYYLFGAGFVLFGVGVVIEGILFELFQLDIFLVHLIENIVRMISLSMILYSIYASEV